MIAEMTPERQPGVFVFCAARDPGLTAAALAVARASFREEGGTSFVLALEDAARLGFDCDLQMAQITLKVFSSLEGIGLTAAVAGLLTERGIPCNVVAATHHDHVFVPIAMAEAALEALRDLQARAAEAPQ